MDNRDMGPGGDDHTHTWIPASRGSPVEGEGGGGGSEGDVGLAQLRSSGHHSVSLSACELGNLEAGTHGPFPTL